MQTWILNVLKHLLVFVGALLPCALVNAESSQTDNSLEESISLAVDISKSVAKSLQPLLEKPIVVLRVKRNENTPMATVVTKNGTCIVMINAKSEAWSQWHYFLGMAKLNQQDTFEFAAAHEIAHCINKQAILSEDQSQRMITDDLSSLNLAPGRPSETFADLFGLAYISERRCASDLKNILQAVIKVRRSFGSSWLNTHATSASIIRASHLLLSHVHENKKADNLVSFSMALYRKSVDENLVEPL